MKLYFYSDENKDPPALLSIHDGIDSMRGKRAIDA
jgi:hypothetical protein